MVAVRLANRTRGPSDLDTISLFLDTDGSVLTGDPLAHGADRLVVVTGDANGLGALRAQWTSGAWTLPAAHAGVSADWLAPDIVVSAGLGALGDVAGVVRLSVVAVQEGINPDPNTDYAPDDPGSPYVYTMGAGDPPPTGGPPPPPPPGTRPDTRIIAGPSGATRSRKASFRFRSTKPRSTFRCKLDGRPWHPCTSPRTWRGLAPGWHIFRVAARDAQGRLDPTPAFRIWRIR